MGKTRIINEPYLICWISLSIYFLHVSTSGSHHMPETSGSIHQPGLTKGCVQTTGNCVSQLVLDGSQRLLEMNQATKLPDLQAAVANIIGLTMLTQKLQCTCRIRIPICMHAQKTYSEYKKKTLSVHLQRSCFYIYTCAYIFIYMGIYANCRNGIKAGLNHNPNTPATHYFLSQCNTIYKVKSMYTCIKTVQQHPPCSVVTARVVKLQIRLCTV